VRAADGILLVSPEYNYSVPGVLKNAIDWVSRPPDPPFSGKPAGLMGASTGISGTMRAQLALRQCFVFTQTYALQAPEVVVAKCADRFDADLRLTDEPTREVVRTYLVRLRDWARTIGKG
jgi:chromate reductase